MKKQQKFKVADNETIQDCFEEPIYKENKDGSLEVLKQEIEFVGKMIEQ